MSVEPPSSGRPTGPPSGPLSGPTRPNPVPPPDGRVPTGSSTGGPGEWGGAGAGGGGQGGGSGGGPGDGGSSGPSGPGAGQGPERPWWKSVPRVALIAAAVVVAVVLAVVLTRPDGTTTAKSSDGEVFLQAAGKSGPDPFTGSTARDGSTAPVTPSPTDTSGSANVTRGVDGSAPGLYGGTRDRGSCDVEKQISALDRAPDKKQAFAKVLDLKTSAVPAYLRSLTPVQLRMDTRVTNHGYRDGGATSYQAVLQAGTAVLVDDRGVPRVRCACGNPLLPPVALKTTPRTTGDSWPSYRPSDVVVVSPSTQVVDIFVIFDADSGDWFTRHQGDTGGKDRRTDPPAHQPSPSMSSPPPSSDSPSPCVSVGDGATVPPGGSASPCPSTSSSPATPSSPSEESGSPSSAPPAPDSSEPAPDDASGTTTESAASHGVPESAATSPGL
ncbi:hypothetical protein J8N05_44760 [Streptomyces sp. BH-SS-21]|uniref:DUF6777 domain-containing protein n=1 Tax=Streptomyces liliiviolaceus TaxID=2823109 RepID=A0A940Y9W5_9ACTN|nr:DUF6777 domain-containing protein [Streptomyces liliiviolaceus]MBQ0855285.1 hypothetical protein [Streptomyces liliiviolaceus]